MVVSDLAVRAREARAKINLSLRVGSRRADGLHGLDSLLTIVRGVSDRVISDSWDEQIFSMAGAFADDLADALQEQIFLQEPKSKQQESAKTAEQSPQESPEHNPQQSRQESSQESLQRNAVEDNLAWRAACVFDTARRGFGVSPAPLPIRLEKNLPFGAGFGGGSADAAAVLLLRAGEIPTDLATLCHLAVGLGADIPALLHAETGTGAVWVSGAGEICVPAPALPQTYVVLAWPKVSLSTQKVYAAFAAERNSSSSSESEDAQATRVQEVSALADAKALAAWAGGQGNDLAEAVAAVCPEAEILRKRLGAQKHCLLAQISGAGSGCFGLFTQQRHAVRAASQLRDVWASVGVIGSEAAK